MEDNSDSNEEDAEFDNILVDTKFFNEISQIKETEAEKDAFSHNWI